MNSYCGLECKTCYFQIPIVTCKFIAPKDEFINRCKIAISKDKQFCGECDDYPCKILVIHPTDFETEKEDTKTKQCKTIKDALVVKARKGINPVGYCGHHCDFCFLGQWCGGCRSNFNCCSFATLFPDGICPNIKCAEEKSLYGCYKCAELSICNKGYYGRKNEYIAKATALFIKEYGEECYTATLNKAIKSGKGYPKSFDASGSVDNALNILRKYLCE